MEVEDAFRFVFAETDFVNELCGCKSEVVVVDEPVGARVVGRVDVDAFDFSCVGAE